MTNIKFNGHKTPNSAKENNIGSGKHGGRPVEPQTKRKKISENSTDERMPVACIGSEVPFTNTLLDEPTSNTGTNTPVQTPVDSLFNEIMNEPIVDEINMNELFEGFDFGPNSDWNQIELEIATQEVDADEFVEEEPQFFDECGNEIHGKNIAAIKHNENDETFGIKDGELVHTSDENATEIFDMNFKKVLFSNYYRVIGKIGNKVTVVCRSCELILNDSDSFCNKTRHHLWVCTENTCLRLCGVLFNLI